MAYFYSKVHELIVIKQLPVVCLICPNGNVKIKLFTYMFVVLLCKVCTVFINIEHPLDTLSELNNQELTVS